jgi:hypothetical protein
MLYAATPLQFASLLLEFLLCRMILLGEAMATSPDHALS